MPNITKSSKKQRLPEWCKGLTARQVEFIRLYCDGASDSCADLIKSYHQAGYKASDIPSNDKIAAQRMFRSPKVQNGMRGYISHRLSRVDVGRDMSLLRLEETYNAAVASGDNTARVQCVKLMMQYNQLLSINLNIGAEFADRLESKVSEEVAALARLRVGQIISENRSDLPADVTDVSFESITPKQLEGAVIDSPDKAENSVSVASGVILAP